MVANVETMAYSGDVPWHGLGKSILPDSTPQEMLEAADLDWEVKKHMLSYEGEDGNRVSTEKYALVRSSDKKILTYPGPQWTPLQNRDAMRFFAEYTEAGKATMETAGSLNGGRIVWGLANLNHRFEAQQGDKVGGYLLLMSPHIVGASISVRTTTVRVVCSNTMALAMQNGTEHWSQNHLKEFSADKAKAAVERSHQELINQEQAAKILVKLKLGEDDSMGVLMRHFDPELAINEKEMPQVAIMDPTNWNSKLRGVANSLNNAPGAQPGTGWGVLNAATHYLDHVAGRSADARLTNAWLGKASRTKLAVQRELLDMAA